MARTWTDAQKHCIEATDGTLLVSAAAGSGKTSVLVERVLRRITTGGDIDRLLIVTFTKAAAAEMKQRLSAGLSAAVAAFPENAHLLRQQLLLPCAMITTIDGFCAALLREHFDILGLSPRFRVLEDTAGTLMKNEALEETLEQFYAARDPHFLELCDLLNGRRDDRGIKDAVLSAYAFISAEAFPLTWLRQSCGALPDGTALSDTPWGKILRRYAAEQIGFFAEQIETVAAPFAPLPEAAGYYDRLMTDVRLLEQCALALSDADNDWDRCIYLLGAAVPGRLPAAKGLDTECADAVKAAYGTLRDTIRKKLLPLFGESEAAARADIAGTLPRLAAFCSLVEAFDSRYLAKKAADGAVDFSDLEHLSLRLLCDENGAPTPLAKDIGARFDEILVDEYQDTNHVQDTLFSMLSEGGTPLFMVGDVKQSIYGFRQAMPEIFMQKKAAFAPFDGEHYPAVITLGENFRSRKSVTDTVNFVFSQLMTAPFCGIDYKDGEALIPKATYPAADCTTELLLMDNPFADKEMKAAELEARLIAMRIGELMQSQTVTENGSLRPLRFGDICILLRSRSDHAATYAAVFEQYGIPASTDAPTPFFETTEVRTAVALLEVIDNPLLDVPLFTALLSPVGGFCADDVAALRIAQPSGALYTALTAAAAEDGALAQKAATFTATLAHFRRLGATVSAGELLAALFDETPLLAAAAADVGGAVRVANLRQLLQMAHDYEQNSFKGLSGFVRQLARLQAENPSLAAAAPAGGENAVHIMTVHGSKGLEFPVVFLSNLFRKCGGDISRRSLLLHSEAGVALSAGDSDTLTARRTVSQNGVMTAVKYTSAAEELRVLYVAMTRAREKLIAVFLQKNLPARLQTLARCLPRGKTLDRPRMMAHPSFGDWLLSAFLRHPDAVLLRDMAGSLVETLPAEGSLFCRLVDVNVLPAANAVKTPPPADAETAAALKAHMAYRYPFAALSGVPVKLAVSALAHRKAQADYIATRRPAFLAEDGMTPAERGTALHTFMQYADYMAAAADVKAEADRLLADDFLTAAQRDALDLDRLSRFFEGPLFARMCKASRLWREYAFTMPLAARVFDPTLPKAAENEPLMVQGIADCVFEEDGALVIVDYKTDRVRDPAVLRERYKEQLSLYRRALSETLSLPVGETLLYAFYTGETVEV